MTKKSYRLNPPEAKLNKLISYYQTGQFKDAEKIAISIAREFPKHPIGWKLLGAIYWQTGRKFEATKLNRKAVSLSPNDAEAHYNLGVMLQESGNFQEAEISYQTAIKLKPDYIEAYSNLGSLFEKLEKNEEAEICFRKAIKFNPEYAPAFRNLGVLFQKQTRLLEAEENFRQAIALNTNYYEAHSNLGVTLQELERVEQAEASFRKAIAIKPDYSEAHSNLGVLLRECGRIEEALKCYNQAIAFKTDYAMAYFNLGVTLLEICQYRKAEENFRQAITYAANYPEAHGNLGVTLLELSRYEEAKESFVMAIKLKPDYAEAFSNLGVALKALGKFVDAEKNFLSAVKINPNYAEAHRRLSLIKKFGSQDEQYAMMRKIYNDPNTTEIDLCNINFGLAKACEDLEDYRQAFNHYKQGNALRKKMLRYDINQDVELFEKLKLNCSKLSKHSLKVEPNNSLQPVFIVGLPRSGTTLVEQVISCHPQATGAGELTFVKQFGQSIANGDSEINAEILSGFREEYLKHLLGRSDGNTIVIDKMPQNFRFLGLIAAAIPEAKIVHVKRQPAAVCWANYKTYFPTTDLGYCYDLRDITHYFELYTNLMKFWINSISSMIYDLDYELLTANPGDEIRKLINFLNLDWDERCLSPQNNKRSVSSASNMQVRQKIYTGSSLEWEKFKPYLAGGLDFLIP